ncbi:MAG TPA: 4-coumarate--CoA ligase, partial [Pseudomonas sp.]|nr:4-coumarate--CoA ligase [Pseudomonas sp.]
MVLSASPDAPDLNQAFAAVPDLIAYWARHRPDQSALLQDGRRLSYAELDTLISSVAAALQRDGLLPGNSLAICAYNSIEYAVVFLGALRAGLAVAPVAPSASAE